MKVQNISFFDRKGSESTGGLTGSMKVKGNDNDNYQLKPSILDNKWMRKKKAKGTDRENFGEFISACIAKGILDSPQTVPEVSLVYDKENKRVLIASKYLKGELVRTLDQYAIETGLINNSGKKFHVSIVNTTPQKDNEVSLETPEFYHLSDTLCEAIAVSAIVGDHDVNPGNMMVITNGDNSHIGRIDFGHAFNDLLKAPEMFGGRILNSENSINDFLNREKVAGLNAQSKLRRDYPGIILSEQMAKALIKIGQTPDVAIENGIEDAKESFQELINIMKKNQDIKGLIHLDNSLAEICKNFTDSEILDQKPVFKNIDKLFKDIEFFIKCNRDDALETGCLIKAQITINRLIQTEANIEEIKEIVKKSIPGFFNDNETVWIKESNGAQSFIGNAEKYITQKKVDFDFQQAPVKIENKLAKSIIDWATTYRQCVASQKVMNATGLKKAEILDDKLYQIAQFSHTGNFEKALHLTQELKNELKETFGEKNIIGKSVAFEGITQIEQSLQKIIFQPKQDSVKERLQALKISQELSVDVERQYHP